MWTENSFTKLLTEHSFGRKILSQLGTRFYRKSLTSQSKNFDMVLDLNDKWGVSKYILKYGNYDPELTAICKKLIEPGAVVLDIGANIGYWSVFFATVCKCSEIISFEPEPQNLQLLRKNIELNQSEKIVTIIPKALGAKPAQLKLYLSKDNAGDHQLYASNDNRKFITVDVAVFDQLYPNKKVDLIKIDTQGFEPYIFLGLKETLTNNPNIKIITEFWPSNIKKAGNDPLAFLHEVQNMGFIIYALEANSNALKKVNPDEAIKLCPDEVHIDLVLSRSALNLSHFNM